MQAFTVTESGNYVLSAELLKPIYDSFVQNIGVILPICIGIFGILIAVSLIPKIVNMFSGNKK